jgi:surface protein
VSGWDVSAATDMSYLFSGCSSFRSEVSRWDLSRATDVRCMFDGCVLFNSDVSQWNVSRAANKSQSMFFDCPMFDRELVSGWPLTAALRLQLFLKDESATMGEVDEDEEETEDEVDEEAAEDEDENN